MDKIQDKLARLRSSMKDTGTDAYIIPSADPHLGESIPDHWQIIQWLTGFTGSSATVVITQTFAGLWTDSRYFIQAEHQLQGTGITHIKPLLTGINDFTTWLKENLTEGSRIAFDGNTFSISRLRKLENSLKGQKIFIDIDKDLISELWTDRPELPDLMAFDHDISFCGVSRYDKIARVRDMMKQTGVNYNLLCAPDDIMWMLNLRGGDLKFSPLLLSFAIIGEEQILLFTNENKIPFKIASEFDKLNIVILPYEETAAILSTLEAESVTLISPASTSAVLYNSIPDGITIVEGLSIPARLKSIKNKTEIFNIGKVMIKDGTSLTKFFFWLETIGYSSDLTELSISEKLNEFRSGHDTYLGPSFQTISAFNHHGALPHYNASPETDSKINGTGILLIDSGGQYLDGTTDITRTIAIGRPSPQQRTDFTLVLKGMISMAMAKFPSSTRGYQLDILARKSLWEHGLNYGHGTGHGVGFCLNVHEGPQSISPATNPDSNNNIIQPGMLLSNEPAIYREGDYGIRIENLILCYEDEESEFGKFLRFDTVSLCYIDKNLIDRSLLEPKELSWLNSYHSEVYEKLSPYLTGDEKEWLKNKTRSI